jgi:hypothetical protein
MDTEIDAALNRTAQSPTEVSMGTELTGRPERYGNKEAAWCRMG